MKAFIYLKKSFVGYGEMNICLLSTNFSGTKLLNGRAESFLIEPKLIAFAWTQTI